MRELDRDPDSHGGARGRVQGAEAASTGCGRWRSRSSAADNQKTLEAKQDELVKAFTESLATAAKSVAAEKKLALVVARELVLTGGIDITNEVLAKLNATGK